MILMIKKKKTITSYWFLFFILDTSSSGTSDKESKDKNASNIFKILEEVDSAVEKKEYAKLAKILSEEKICRADIIPTFWAALKARDDKALDIIMNGGFTPNLNLLKVTIVACQRGGVSNKPPWAPGSDKTLGQGSFDPFTGGPIQNLKKETDRTFDPLFTKTG